LIVINSVIYFVVGKKTSIPASVIYFVVGKKTISIPASQR
jgi:hypothetical protein